MVGFVLFINSLLRRSMFNISFYPFIISFDELLELSQRGDNSTIDMLVGDIYGGMDYSKACLFTHIHVSSSLP